MAPGRTRAEARKLRTMMDDLAQMRQELIPDEREKQRKEEMKSFDDFQKKKHTLNSLLQDIRVNVDRLNELRKKLGRDERDTTTIRLQSENSDRLRQALDQFNDLKKQLDRDANKGGRKKISETELADRRHLVMLIGEDLKDLTGQNSRVKMPLTEDDEALQARIARRKAMDEEARERREKSRKSRRLRKGESAIDDGDIEMAVRHNPGTEQEQAFEEKVQHNMAEQDQMLEEISKGLDELKELANEASKQLTVQKAMLDQVDDKMDQTMRQFKTANVRLKNLLEESGGMSRWCPILVLAVVILALVGYAIHVGGI